MLPTEHRLRRSDEFRLVFRRGRRYASKRIVVHLYKAEPTHAVRVGFVVSKAVGNAVVRNRVKRRLRAIAHTQVQEVPEGALMVVRALPMAARSDYISLKTDLDECLRRADGGSARRS